MSSLNDRYYSEPQPDHPKSIFDAPFSHVYVEKTVREYPRAKRILGKLGHATVIEIDHYKDVFCRKKQSISIQNQSPMLILAAKHGHLVYPGSPVCQNFNERYFYYTSCVMNCLYDCEYCYLKGMYPSGNVVVFVNIEDIFAEVEQLLAEHEVYLCVSYDTDLMALEELTGFVSEWGRFVEKTASRSFPLKIEIRTKCGRTDLWERLTPQENIIFAFTLSPQSVIERYEHRTASLTARLACVRPAMEAGFPVRLCFDPMLYVPDWKQHYAALLQQVTNEIPMSRLYDVSVGSFRISQDYLKKIRRVLPDSAVVQFPFENDHGVYHYPTPLMNEMEDFLVSELLNHLPEDRIFRWK